MMTVSKFTSDVIQNLERLVELHGEIDEYIFDMEIKHEPDLSVPERITAFIDTEEKTLTVTWERQCTKSKT